MSLFKRQNYRISAVDFNENQECEKTFVIKKENDGQQVYDIISKGLGSEKVRFYGARIPPYF